MPCPALLATIAPPRASAGAPVRSRGPPRLVASPLSLPRLPHHL